MIKMYRMGIVLGLLSLMIPAWGDLQNIEVGGSLRIRANYYSPEAAGTVALFEERGNSLSFIEQRTRIHFLADFTDDVKAFVELDSYDIWGEDFRSDPITGVDNRSVTGDDVEVYQAYIEMQNVFDVPLTVRIGRQEISLGSEWLVGNNDFGSFFYGLSFDGVRLIYTEDTWNVTAFATKVQENSPIEEDGDVDFYGIYGGYTGLPGIVFEAYWLYLRDARGSDLGFGFDTSNAGLSGRVLDGIEEFFGVDQYSGTQSVNTIGARVAGSRGPWDFAGEFAYQRGEASNVTKFFFSPDPATSGGTPYGEDDAEYDRIAYDIEGGYTFSHTLRPRLFLGFAWIEGEDRREESYGDWLHTFYSFHETDASVSFNRLFSDWKYSEFLASTDLSNALVLRGGYSMEPTEKLDLTAIVSYFQVDSPSATNGAWGLPWNSIESDDSLGTEVGLYLGYDYSDDLHFELGYAHFFADDGVDSNARYLGRIFPKLGGNFVAGNGLIRVGGVGQDDADYLYVESSVSF